MGCPARIGAVLSRFRTRLATIAGAGFALRAVVALAVPPAVSADSGDQRFFHVSANLLADGHGFIIPSQWLVSGASIPATEHPPLWSGVLALFSLLGARRVDAHELVGCGVGAVTICCAGLIGRRVAGERSGVLAALGCAAFPVFVVMDGSLMSEPLYALCVAVVLLAALRFAEVRTLRAGAVLGLAIGVSSLVRFEALALIVLLVLPLALRMPSRRPAHLAVACLTALAVIAPWCVRNSVALDEPLLVSTEMGPVLAGANCGGTYSGYDMGYWRASCVTHAPDPNSAFASERLTRLGIRYVRHHAARLPAVEGVRLLRTFGLWQPTRLVYFAEGRYRPGRSWAVLACWAIFALAIAGAAVLWRIDRLRLAILLAPVALAVLITLLAFGYPRFRYAADVALIVLAAVACDALIGRLGIRARRRVGRAVSSA